MEVIALLLPFIIILLVALAKRFGLSSQTAPALMGLLAGLTALGVYLIYPDQSFKSIVTTIYAGLGSAGIYSIAKFAKNTTINSILPGGT